MSAEVSCFSFSSLLSSSIEFSAYTLGKEMSLENLRQRCGVGNVEYFTFRSSHLNDVMCLGVARKSDFLRLPLPLLEALVAFSSSSDGSGFNWLAWA